MLFIDILLLFLYEVDSYESTNRIYETLTSLCKLSNLIILGVTSFIEMWMVNGVTIRKLKKWAKQ